MTLMPGPLPWMYLVRVLGSIIRSAFYFLQEYRPCFSRFSDFQENFKILAFICKFPSPPLFCNFKFWYNLKPIEKKSQEWKKSFFRYPLSRCTGCYHFPHLLYHSKFPIFISISRIKLNKNVNGLCSLICHWRLLKLRPPFNELSWELLGCLNICILKNVLQMVLMGIQG